ncbi:MAG: peptidoglycan DD-metalloendopeptidase family protein [Candidatus Paceibacterota bacterium]|jgi:LysM repeat protein
MKDGLKNKSLLFCFLGGFASLAFFGMASSKDDLSSQTQDSNDTGKYIAGSLLSAKDSVETIQPYAILEGSSLKSVPSPVFAAPQTLASMSGEPEADSQSERVERDIIQYTVKEGDTLASLAEKFNISLETILWANDLKKWSSIKPGEKLVILPISGVMHIIEEKDTLSKVAKSYSSSQDDIIAFNQLDAGADLMLGDILVVPGGKISPAAVSSPVKNVVSPASVALSNSFFMIPTTGHITQTLHVYNAVDVGGPCGTPVYASAGGKIQVSTNAWPYGNYIRIVHPNSVVTLYAHLSRNLVSVGQEVSQGQLIGYIGNTGHVVGATGCHLHFETRGSANPLAKYNWGSALSFK